MPEETINAETPKLPSPVGNVQNDDKKEASIIDEAKKVNEELIKNLEALKSERIRFEKVLAEHLVQGKSLAGSAVQPTEQEIIKKNCMKMFEGTGLNPFK